MDSPSDFFDEDSMLTMRPDAGPALGRIDQYELVRKLGGGGFGVVYLARDTASGVEVALKTLHPLLKHSPEEMETLREKFAIVSRLAHPNVATALVLHPVRDVVIVDEPTRQELKLSPGDSVMVMRYAPGVTLSKWRRQFPGGIVPFDQALEVGRQIASALDHAHSERIVHRDVKPGNVMVETLAAEPQGHGHEGKVRVRILDFGLAAEIRSSMSRVSTEQGDTSGTRPYMAPEQWAGRRQDGRTDQYALACVLYELLSGAPPFAGVFETGDPVIMRTTVLSDSPEALEKLPEFVNAALLRALSKDPKDRFPTCSDFVAALSEETDGTRSPEPTETDSPKAHVRPAPSSTEPTRSTPSASQPAQSAYEPPSQPSQPAYAPPPPAHAPPALPAYSAYAPQPSAYAPPPPPAYPSYVPPQPAYAPPPPPAAYPSYVPQQPLYGVSPQPAYSTYPVAAGPVAYAPPTPALSSNGVRWAAGFLFFGCFIDFLVLLVCQTKTRRSCLFPDLAYPATLLLHIPSFLYVMAYLSYWGRGRAGERRAGWILLVPTVWYLSEGIWACVGLGFFSPVSMLCVVCQLLFVASLIFRRFVRWTALAFMGAYLILYLDSFSAVIRGGANTILVFLAAAAVLICTGLLIRACCRDEPRAARG